MSFSRSRSWQVERQVYVHYDQAKSESVGRTEKGARWVDLSWDVLQIDWFRSLNFLARAFATVVTMLFATRSVEVELADGLLSQKVDGITSQRSTNIETHVESLKNSDFMGFPARNAGAAKAAMISVTLPTHFDVRHHCEIRGRGHGGAASIDFLRLRMPFQGGVEEGLGEGAGSEMRSGTVGGLFHFALRIKPRWMATSVSGSDLRGSFDEGFVVLRSLRSWQTCRFKVNVCKKSSP